MSGESEYMDIVMASFNLIQIFFNIHYMFLGASQ